MSLWFPNSSSNLSILEHACQTIKYNTKRKRKQNKRKEKKRKEKKHSKKII